MAHSRGFSGRRTPSLKTWLGQLLPAFGTDVADATPGGFSPGLKVFGTPDVVDVTILRTRGRISAITTSAGGSADYMLALGIGLCTTEASLAGAVPLPFDNPSWDGWFVYQVMPVLAQGSGNPAGAMEIDSKAMRKVPAGQVLFLATQIFTGAGGVAQVFNEIIQVRQLQKTS